MKIIEINQKSWLSLFQDKIFLQALTIASMVTLKNGCETAFFVEIDDENKFWIDEVIMGDFYCMYDKIAGNKTIFKFPAYYYSGFRASIFLLHFHPDENIIIPSSGDLKMLSRKLPDDKPFVYFIGIGIVDLKKGHVSFLLIKKKHALSNPDAYEFNLPDTKIDTVNQEEVIKILESSGYIANIFYFSNSPKGLHFKGKQERKLKLYTTKIIPE